MVRGDTRRPSFTSNSLAIRSWPQDGFSRAILRIRRLRSGGIRDPSLSATESAIAEISPSPVLKWRETPASWQAANATGFAYEASARSNGASSVHVQPETFEPSSFRTVHFRHPVKVRIADFGPEQ
jgi:hypothetical protein